MLELVMGGCLILFCSVVVRCHAYCSLAVSRCQSGIEYAALQQRGRYTVLAVGARCVVTAEARTPGPLLKARSPRVHMEDDFG